MGDNDRTSRPVLAVLLSGGGRTLANLIDQSANGDLQARIGIVVSSVAGAGGIEIARNAGIPTVTLLRKEFDSDAAYSEAIFATIAPYDPALVILAGFLRKVIVPPEWDGRILNIHPALLPECSYASGRGFYGDRVHAAVLAQGESVSGATVHLVDNGYDTGPVYMRQRVPVEPDDDVRTLAARVFQAETELYPRAIAAYLEEQRAATCSDGA
ncbi:MAG: phosphoribosylglycinamide formyltransferase [Thermomicrobiales bacterium]|nr:phosphoribosylglycinamide formyltransferase [Thermomicrobiales bacterium]MCO5220524.1 phosphoribosylglycinamide formyltransferase [Thermomicrobiales bacterium]